MKKSNPIRAERELILHTELANRMFDGRHGRARSDRHSRNKCRIAGLRLFASRVRTIWHDARAGNPFAHWWLVQIERVLTEAAKELRVTTEEYERLLKTRSFLEIRQLGASKPHRRQVSFHSPLAYDAARLIAHLDHLLLLLIECTRQNLISVKEKITVGRAAARCILRVFNLGLRYRHYDISFKDIARPTAWVLRATEEMGPIPPEIINGSLRAQCAPAPRNTNAPLHVQSFEVAEPVDSSVG
ncbi:MAG: PFL_4669 family integrating conjugative element protein [Gammaproteobacteria bacterium]